MDQAHNLLVELYTEELPPRALPALSRAFAGELASGLRARDLAAADAVITPYATPRRLAVHIRGVLARGPDRPVEQKLMPVRVGLDAGGQPRPPLLKKLNSLGVDTGVVPELARVPDGKQDMLVYRHIQPGMPLQQGLQEALEQAIARLPIPKVMTYQLHHGTALPGWDSTHFVRPVHGVLALHGADVVPVTVLGLSAGRHTHGHRFEARQDPIAITDADAYEVALQDQGAVVVSFAHRRDLIAKQLQEAAARAGAGLQVMPDDALLDEVTALVENPNTLVCQFEEAYLAVPPECLILTMKTNQKYFPLRDAAGELSNRFLVVSNIRPADPAAIIAGNERVVRARLADARFFYDQDRKQTLESRIPGLEQVVYHARLGSQGARMERVRAIAARIAEELGVDAALVDQAARLAKTDLLTGMVGEFPELQGVMGRYYAQHEGLPQAVADAMEDHYKPRFSGDELPRGPVGTVLALADKLETLAGLFGVGEHPTGDKDPFALRRHALGVLRMLAEKQLSVSQRWLLQTAAAAMPEDLVPAQSADSSTPLWEELDTFLNERAVGYWQGQGLAEQDVDAVLQVCQVPAQMKARLQAVRAFNELPEAQALAAANKRITNILRKSADAQTAPRALDDALLQEPAEQALHARMQEIVPQANRQFDAGDYTASLTTLAGLRDPVDAFFAGVMVNADDPALRANRLALLQGLHTAMNRVADLSRLA